MEITERIGSEAIADTSCHALHCIAKVAKLKKKDGNLEERKQKGFGEKSGEDERPAFMLTKPWKNLVNRLLEQVGELTAKHHLSKSFWSLGKMRATAEKNLLSAMEEQAGLEIDSFDAQGVATILHAYASLGQLPRRESFMQALLQRAQTEASEGSLNAQDVATSLWALAKINWRPDEALQP